MDDNRDDGINLVQEKERYDNIEQNTPMSSIQILSKSGLYLSLMTMAMFATQVIIAFIMKMISPDVMETGLYSVVATLIGMVGVGLPVFAKLMKKIPDSEIGERKKLSPIKFIGFFIVCVASAYIANIVGLLISAFIELINGVEVGDPVGDFLYNEYMVLAMVYAIIIAPIVEELIFRRILLNKLRRFGDLPAMLITGIAFGIFHFNLAQFFYAAVLGILFAFITIRTNRIVYAMVLHMLMNFIGAGLAPIATSSQNKLGLSLVVLWFFATMVIGSILFILNVKRVILLKPRKPLVRTRDYIMNPGTLLFLIMSISVIFLGLIG